MNTSTIKFSNNVSYKVDIVPAPISITEAANRLIMCGEALGITNKNFVNFDAIKNEYKDKYGFDLNRVEMDRLFGFGRPKAALSVVKRYFTFEDRSGTLYLKLARPKNVIKEEINTFLEYENCEPISVVDTAIKVTGEDYARLEKQLVEIDNELFDEGSSDISNDKDSQGDADESDNNCSDDEDSNSAFSVKELQESEEDDEDRRYTDDERPSPKKQAPSTSKTSEKALTLAPDDDFVDPDKKSNPLKLTRKQMLSVKFEDLEKHFIKTTLPAENNLANLPPQIYDAVEPKIDEYTKWEESFRGELISWFNEAKATLSDDHFIEDLKLICQAMTVVYIKREIRITELNEMLQEVFDKYLPPADEDEEEDDSDFDLMF